MSVQLPETGIVFWPVGCGDSTTICVNKECNASREKLQLKKNNVYKKLS
jgi:hypothetical protein